MEDYHIDKEKKILIIDPSRYASVPDELKERKQWANWKFEKKEGKDKLDKVPCNSEGYKIDYTKNKNLKTFDQVLNTFRSGKFDGVNGGLEMLNYGGIKVLKCISTCLLLQLNPKTTTSAILRY